MDEVQIERLIGKEWVYLTIFSDTPSDFLIEIPNFEAESWGEEKVQLQEGCNYHYKLTDGYQLAPISKLIIPHRKPDNNRGVIKTGNFTGTLVFDAFNIENPLQVVEFSLEVQSKKTNYRSEYRLMLEEIAEFSIDLLLKHSSPIVQTITPNFDVGHRSLYQKFAFINAIVGSEEFFEAINRIVRTPVTEWKSTEIETDIRKAHRFDKQVVSQFASSNKRFNLSKELQNATKLPSLPTSITHFVKQDSLDTPDNQFVKHVLSEYYFVCDLVASKLKVGSREKREAENLADRLRNTLSQSFFTQISTPKSLALNSPVLQKKEGYREVYKTWLMFDLGSKLIWEGGEGVFIAGKKDIARLYEYWVFFKLLHIIGAVFPNFSDSYTELIKLSSDGLDLSLKSGVCTKIQRLCSYDTRDIEVEFSFNQTFSGTNDENYPKRGSWTRAMRPDYTLSFWPQGFFQEEAEEQELIIHIHFDAKYRIENITDAFGSNSLDAEDGDENDTENRDFRRIDLIKMHAYKDAIRRTAGAYILYPGTENKIWRGYHEIIPGLGAFTLRPSKGNEGSAELKTFLEEVIDQLLNRASKYEETTYHTFQTQTSPAIEVREQLPEKYDQIRAKPPQEILCLVGYVRDNYHWEWIKKTGLYNIRLASSEMAAEDEAFAMNFTGISYLVLHGKLENNADQLFEITNLTPKVMTNAELLAMGYPNPKHDRYLVFSTRENDNQTLRDLKFNLDELPDLPKNRSRTSPFVTTLSDLLNIVAR